MSGLELMSLTRVKWSNIDDCHQIKPFLPQVLLGGAQPGPATGALHKLVQEMEGVEVRAGVEGREEGEEGSWASRKYEKLLLYNVSTAIFT